MRQVGLVLRVSGICLLVCAGSGLLPARAVAQVAAGASDPQAEAQAHFARGSELVAQGWFDEACPEFLASYGLVPSSIVLFHYASCLAQCERWEQAFEALSRYLVVHNSSLSDAERADATARLESIRARLVPARILITDSACDAPAVLSVDGRVLGSTPIPDPLYLEPGVRRFDVVAEGCEPASRSETLQAGPTGTLNFELSPPTGIVHVATDVPEAEITVCGRTLGTGVAEGSLVRGECEVVVVADDYYEHRETVVVPPNGRVDLDVTLEAIPPTPWYEEWWVWTLIGVGVLGTTGGIIGGVYVAGQAPDATWSVHAP
jgi:hypothetical protein